MPMPKGNNEGIRKIGSVSKKKRKPGVVYTSTGISIPSQ